MKKIYENNSSANDIYYMKEAYKEAKKSKGKTGLNPAVGAVIVKNGKIIGKGRHKYYGGAHAEIEAINSAKKSNTNIKNSDLLNNNSKNNAIKNSTTNLHDFKNAVIYVTLEPCSHYGKTPPCVEAIIKNKFKKVVIGMIDPNPLVKEKGIKKLNENGIKTEIQDLNGKIQLFYRDFIKYIKTKEPYIRLKAAISIDGKIALKNNFSQWITNEKSRKFVHKLRSEVDAVLIGKNTLINDNPNLTIRYNLKNKENFIIILDNNLDFNNKYNIYSSHNKKKIILVTNSSDKEKINQLKSNKINIIKTACDKNGLLNIKNILKEIANFGIKDILVEGGGKLYTYLLENKIIDETYFFISNKIIGNDGIAVFENLKLQKFDYTLKNINYEKFDDNILIHGYL